MMEIQLGSGRGDFADLQKAFDIVDQPDTISKTESLWDSWNFK